MKLAYLVLFIVVAAVVGAEISLSLAGRETVLKYVPFMSLQAALIVVIAICLVAVYVTWAVARTRKWRWLAFFVSAIVLVAGGCVLLFAVASERSTNEAASVVADFLANPRKHRVSYSGRTSEESLSPFRPTAKQLDLVFSSHPYGRYVFRLGPESGGLIIQLNKDFEETRLFVFRTDEYPGPKKGT